MNKLRARMGGKKEERVRVEGERDRDREINVFILVY